MDEDEKPHEAHPVHHAHRRRGLLGRFRANFLTGLVVVLPIGLTFWFIWNIIGWIDSWILPFIPFYWQPDALYARFFGQEPPFSVRGVGVVIFLVFTVVVGWIAKGLIGRSLIGWGEGLVDRMPFVRSIYTGLKQIAETVFSQGEAKFDRACLVEYPRKGMWGVGFVSTAAKGEIAEKIPVDEEILTVFLATTPNPTSGFLLYVPRSQVIMLERMSVEDAAKLIISAGLVYPAERVAPNGRLPQL
jgi:uncharacterized membrane protein